MSTTQITNIAEASDTIYTHQSTACDHLGQALASAYLGRLLDSGVPRRLQATEVDLRNMAEALVLIHDCPETALEPLETVLADWKPLAHGGQPPWVTTAASAAFHLTEAVREIFKIN